LARRLHVGARQSAELFGVGDLAQPRPPPRIRGEALEFTTTWTVLQRARVAVLDGDFQQAVAPWPALTAALVARAGEPSWRLGARLAIVQEPKLVLRLLLVLQQIAEESGRVSSEGLWIPFALSHDMLADLACAQRPSVTVALHELAEQRLAIRRDDGSWLLPHAGHDRDSGTAEPGHRTRKRARLSAHRRLVYSALFEAVASSPGTIVEAGDASRATDLLAEEYASSPRQLRSRIDAALDAVEAGQPRGAFAAAAPHDRLEHLRVALRAAAAGRDDMTNDSIVAEAIALAAAPLDPRGFHWSVRTVELWIRTLCSGETLASAIEARR
jgi:hypothetical protein